MGEARQQLQQQLAALEQCCAQGGEELAQAEQRLADRQRAYNLLNSDLQVQRAETERLAASNVGISKR